MSEGLTRDQGNQIIDELRKTRKALESYQRTMQQLVDMIEVSP